MTAQTLPRTRAQRFQPWLAAVLALSLSFVLMTDAWTSLHARWIDLDGAYSHGYVMLVVALWALVKGWQQGHAKPAFRVWLLPLLLLPAALWVLGVGTYTQAFTHLAIWLAASLLVLLSAPSGSHKYLVLPLLLLSLCLPVWEVFLPILRNVTTVVATSVVRTAGIPAFIDGFSFTLPYGTVVIAGSCAGLSYFLMGLALGGITGLVRHFRFWRFVAAVTLLTSLAIVGNWIRVSALIFIAYYSEMQHPLVYEHGNFGWMIFSVLFVVFLWWIRKWPEATPDKNRSTTKGLTQYGYLWGWSGLCAILLAWFYPALTQPDLPIKRLLPASAYVPEYEGYDAYEISGLTVGQRIWQYGTLIYQYQAQGKELISDNNTMGNPQQIQTVEWPMANGVTVNLSTFPEAGRYRIALHAYLIGSEIVADPFQGKLLQFKQFLKGEQGAALWFMSTECRTENCLKERAMLQENQGVVIQSLTQARL